MASPRINSQLNVIQCSRCQGDTKYHCKTCGLNLCSLCKSKHNLSLDTENHNVVLYKYKDSIPFNHENCATHPDQIYELYCEPCNHPVCYFCKEHRTHRFQLLRTAYEEKRRDAKKLFLDIENKIILQTSLLNTEIRSDINACQKEIIPHQSNAMFSKSKRITHLMESVLCEIILGKKIFLIHKLYQQSMKLRRHILRIRSFEHRYKRSCSRPVQFFRCIKNKRNTGKQDTPLLTQHYKLSLTMEINMEDLIKTLSEIRIIAPGKQRRELGELPLALRSLPVLQKSLSVKGVKSCNHISCVTSDRFWVDDGGSNLFLIDTTTGDKLHHVQIEKEIKGKGLMREGTHTVNHKCELIYIDKFYNINKLFNDGTTTTLINNTDSKWTPMCIYCSPLSEDLLVGMVKDSEKGVEYITGKVMRYDRNGQNAQEIPHSRKPYAWYRGPRFITENTNGDVVVSDLYLFSVVVTSREGIHRFSYPEEWMKSPLSPVGICTDALSHILVYSEITHTVQMLDKDGQFLSHLLTDHSPGMFSPRSLCYDFKTHQLLFGSLYKNRVSFYRYIDRSSELIGKFHNI